MTPYSVSDARVLRIELPYLPPAEYSANRSRGVAWQRNYRVSRGKRGAVEEIVVLVKEQRWEGPPMQKARVRFKFFLPDHRRRDGMGLLERAKPWIDGLVDAGVIADDSLGVIAFPVVVWAYRKGQPGTVVEVEEEQV